jgi:hypothetical protein
MMGRLYDHVQYDETARVDLYEARGICVRATMQPATESLAPSDQIWFSRRVPGVPVLLPGQREVPRSLSICTLIRVPVSRSADRNVVNCAHYDDGRILSVIVAIKRDERLGSTPVDLTPYEVAVYTSHNPTEVFIDYIHCLTKQHP